MSRAKPRSGPASQAASGTVSPRFIRRRIAGGTRSATAWRSTRFVCETAQLERDRQPAGELDQAMVEERRAPLERRRHGGAVELRQQIVGQVAGRDRARGARRPRCVPSDVSGSGGIWSGLPGGDERGETRAATCSPVQARWRTAAGGVRRPRRSGAADSAPSCCRADAPSDGASRPRAPGARRTAVAGSAADQPGRRDTSGSRRTARRRPRRPARPSRPRAPSGRAERSARAPDRRAARRADGASVCTPSRKSAGVIVRVRWRVPSARAASAA